MKIPKYVRQVERSIEKNMPEGVLGVLHAELRRLTVLEMVAGKEGIAAPLGSGAGLLIQAKGEGFRSRSGLFLLNGRPDFMRIPEARDLLTRVANGEEAGLDEILSSAYMHDPELAQLIDYQVNDPTRVPLLIVAFGEGNWLVNCLPINRLAVVETGDGAAH